jgi:hypothetical protein
MNAAELDVPFGFTKVQVTVPRSPLESFVGAQVRSSRFSSVGVPFLCFSLRPTISHQELNRKPPPRPVFAFRRLRRGEPAVTMAWFDAALGEG